MRAIGPNSFPEEDNELLHTPLFKQVSPEQANELIPYLHEAVFDKGDYISVSYTHLTLPTILLV